MLQPLLFMDLISQGVIFTALHAAIVIWWCMCVSSVYADLVGWAPLADAFFRTLNARLLFPVYQPKSSVTKAGHEVMVRQQLSTTYLPACASAKAQSWYNAADVSPMDCDFSILYVSRASSGFCSLG